MRFLPDHASLNKRERALESSFRFVHTRLRNHAESVAFFGGDDAERRIATDQFAALTGHLFKAGTGTRAPCEQSRESC